jgi:hypothetical protein
LTPNAGEPGDVRREMSRPLLIHHHIFKNSGSSIDASLRESFGDAFRAVNPLPRRPVPFAELAALFQEDNRLSAVSSATARWPKPGNARLNAYSIVFMRHPIDRVGSMYTYSLSVQYPDVVSRTLAEYVAWSLEDAATTRPRFRLLQSSQTLFLSDAENIVWAPAHPLPHISAAHFAEASRRLESLGAFGITEAFADSIAQLSAWLSEPFPQLVLVPRHENASAHRAATQEARISAIRDALGPRLYRRLLHANEADMELYEHARRLFAERRDSSAQPSSPAARSASRETASS